MKAMTSVEQILKDAAETYAQRNALYGDNYKRFGAMVLAMFPDGGVHAATPDAVVRLGLLFNCASKLARYCANFADGGHIDSAHDLMVYAAMLEEVTRQQLLGQRDENSNRR